MTAPTMMTMTTIWWCKLSHRRKLLDLQRHGCISRYDSRKCRYGVWLHDHGYQQHSCTIVQDPSMDQVSGHVFYNQAVLCTLRRNRWIADTHNQNHFIQRLCSTTTGQSCPILSLEKALFPRYFGASAQSNSHAILGAVLTSWLENSALPRVFWGIKDTITYQMSGHSRPMSIGTYYHRFVSIYWLTNSSAREIRGKFSSVVFKWTHLTVPLVWMYSTAAIVISPKVLTVNL